MTLINIKNNKGNQLKVNKQFNNGISRRFFCFNNYKSIKDTYKEGVNKGLLLTIAVLLITSTNITYILESYIEKYEIWMRTWNIFNFFFEYFKLTIYPTISSMIYLQIASMIIIVA
jgi:hypothetical protein